MKVIDGITAYGRALWEVITSAPAANQCAEWLGVVPRAVLFIVTVTIGGFWLVATLYDWPTALLVEGRAVRLRSALVVVGMVTWLIAGACQSL